MLKVGTVKMPVNEEVEVIITAKDRATNAINSVGKSLKGLSTTATAVAGVLSSVFIYKTVDAFGSFDGYNGGRIR